MARDYTASVQAVAASAAQDVYELNPADDKPVKITGFELGQSTDFGDANDEGVRIAVRRNNSTSGSGGSTPSPIPGDPHDGAAGFTVEANNTTKASTGSPLVVAATTWSIRASTAWWFPDNSAPGADQGSPRICVELVAAPADSITIDSSVYVREF